VKKAVGRPRVEIEDLSGRRFGLLEALYLSDRLNNGKIMYVCVCDCDREKKFDVVAADLLRGHNKSCGCQSSRHLPIDEQALLRLEGTALKLLKTEKPSRNNRTGYRGVSPRPHGKYRAILNFKGQIYRLGDYDTPEEASEVYKLAKEDFAGGLFEKYGLTK